jgi:Tfp pilus assembly protein PilF
LVTKQAFPDLPINQSLFKDRDKKIILPEEIFKLSQTQEAEFLAFFNKRVKRGDKPHLVVYEFLEERFANFTYYGDTFIAEKAYRLERGNCVSLAILTTALANLAELKYDYRKVNIIPVFENHNNLILSASHFQVILYDPTFIRKPNSLHFSEPNIVIDFYPQSSNIKSKKVSYMSFLSAYYMNLSAFFLVDNKLDKAFLYANKAYEITPKSSDVINLMALLHKKKGDLTSAEKMYEIARVHAVANIDLLSNYKVLLTRLDKFQQAELIQQELDQLDDPNPYRWLEHAMMAEQRLQYRSAERKYLKVIAMAPYVKESYIGLYGIYVKQGRLRKAKDILEQSLEWIYEVQQRNKYNNKINQLIKSA